MNGLTPYAIARIAVSDTGCWLWTGTISSKGYGMGYDGRRSVSAHRLVYAAVVGAVPEGLQLDHICRVRHCVNPDHLEPVTAKENTRRSPLVCPSHCKRGHPLSGANLIRQAGGRRRCRTCQYAAASRSRCRAAAA